MYRGHRIGNVIRTLRTMRLAGARLPDLLKFMELVLPDHPNGRLGYIGRAFCQGLRLERCLMTSSPSELPSAEMFERAENFIDERKSDWSSQPFPELMRTRDYFAFLQFAKDEHLFVAVCGSNPFAGH